MANTISSEILGTQTPKKFQIGLKEIGISVDICKEKV
jgi:hypothetical protein